ncbi:acid protease [Dichomitus squalens]|uniref:Acid protease n=1 Tax=Dichomitus squalens TaxID=114155 RepID=A0A4Q9MB39_9APHY|nr:acid protease [Dichomitus squalens]
MCMRRVASITPTSTYNVLVQVGETFVPLLLDTGSADLWVVTDQCGDSCVQANVPLYPHADLTPAGQDVQLLYGDSRTGTHATGPIGTATVGVAGMSIPDQYFAAIVDTNTTVLQTGSSGILGLGFPPISVIWRQLLSSNTTRVIPPIYKRWVAVPEDSPARQDHSSSSADSTGRADHTSGSQKSRVTTQQSFASPADSFSTLGSFFTRLVTWEILSRPLVVTSLQRDTFSLSETTGTLSLGGLPFGLTDEDLTWVPVRSYSPSQGGLPPPPDAPNEVYPLVWEIPVDDVYLDGTKLPRSMLSPASISLSALIDTGNSLIRGPQDVVEQIISILGNTFDCSIPHTLSFEIGGIRFPVDPRDFAHPRKSHHNSGYPALHARCRPALVSTDPPSSDGFSYSWSLGDPFLKSTLVAFYYGNMTRPSVDPPRVGLRSTVPSNAGAELEEAVSAALFRGGIFPATSQAAPDATPLQMQSMSPSADMVPEETQSMPYDVNAWSFSQDNSAYKQLPPDEIQEWCLSRTAEYQTHIFFIRKHLAPAAYDAVCEIKSKIRGLRHEYNSAAPIHRYLPPELLMEIFAYIHPAMTHRRSLRVLRVCRYWRNLIVKTPQFWANLLSFPLTASSWSPLWHMDRFNVELARSAPQSLTLSLDHCNALTVSTLTIYADRISSLALAFHVLELENVTRLLQRHMPRLRHLSIRKCYQIGNRPTLTLTFPHYPSLHSLQLERSHFYPPLAPHTSLRHLKLKFATVHSLPTTSNFVSSMRSIHDALANFPNLETLCTAFSLSEYGGRGFFNEPAPELTRIVRLPLLRHLEIQDMSAHINMFLRHLDFPSTTSLVLEPAYKFTRGPMMVPVPPGINNASHAQRAEMSLSLCVWPFDGSARWETHGDGVRPVSVTLSMAARRLDIVSTFTSELVNALAPAGGLTSLTAEGTWGHAKEYWTTLIPRLPRLRHLTCVASTTTRDVVPLLGKPQTNGEFLCQNLTHLTVAWTLPYDVSVGSGLATQLMPSDAAVVESREGGVDDDRGMTASQDSLCGMLRTCLTERAGHCGPIQKLSVAFGGSCGIYEAVLQPRELHSFEQRLRDTLGMFLPEIAVMNEELALTVFWIGLEQSATELSSSYLQNIVSITISIEFSDVTLLNQLLTDERLS